VVIAKLYSTWSVNCVAYTVLAINLNLTFYLWFTDREPLLLSCSLLLAITQRCLARISSTPFCFQQIMQFTISSWFTVRTYIVSLFSKACTHQISCVVHTTHTLHTHIITMVLSPYTACYLDRMRDKHGGAGPCTVEMIRQWPAGSHRLVESIKYTIYAVCEIMWSLVQQF